MIRIVEREWRRIDRIVEKEGYNPIDIFCLDVPFSRTDLRKAYHKIARLLHPDKSWNNERFCRIFTIVNDNYKLLLEPEKKRICIREKSAKKAKAKKDLMKLLYGNLRSEKKITDNSSDSICEDLRSIIWKPLEIIKYENNIQKRNIKIVSNISMTGAEYRKNKSKGKKDKHQKGLKQRVTQRKNTERRIVNHQFSFTDNISIEVVN